MQKVIKKTKGHSGLVQRLVSPHVIGPVLAIFFASYVAYDSGYASRDKTCVTGCDDAWTIAMEQAARQIYNQVYDEAYLRGRSDCQFECKLKRDFDQCKA